MNSESLPKPSPVRPQLQFSVQSLMVLTGLLACGLAAWRLSGYRLFVQYFLLLYATGPWFAYLVGECLPTPFRVVRIAMANAILLTMFVISLRLWESWFGWQAVVYVTVITALVWTPQYLAFFYRRAAGI